MSWFSLTPLSSLADAGLTYQLVYPLLESSQNYKVQKYNALFLVLQFLDISTTSVNRAQLEQAIVVLDAIRNKLVEFLEGEPDVSQDKFCLVFFNYFLREALYQINITGHVDKRDVASFVYLMAKQLFTPNNITKLPLYISFYYPSTLGLLDTNELTLALRKYRPKIISMLFHPRDGIYFKENVELNSSTENASIEYRPRLLLFRELSSLFAPEYPKLATSLEALVQHRGTSTARKNRSGILPSVAVNFPKTIKAKDFTWTLTSEPKTPVHHAVYKATKGVVALVIPVPHKDVWYVVADFDMPALQGFSKFVSYMESRCLADLSSVPNKP